MLYSAMCRDIQYSTNYGWVKLWGINCLKSFGEENVGEFTITNISYFSNLEFGWVKYWHNTVDRENFVAK